MGKYNDFEKELTQLINKHSMEIGSHTPDYILAHHLVHSLEIWEHTTKARDNWWNLEPKINKQTF